MLGKRRVSDRHYSAGRDHMYSAAVRREGGVRDRGRPSLDHDSHRVVRKGRIGDRGRSRESNLDPDRIVMES